MLYYPAGQAVKVVHTLPTSRVFGGQRHKPTGVNVKVGSQLRQGTVSVEFTSFKIVLTQPVHNFSLTQDLQKLGQGTHVLFWLNVPVVQLIAVVQRPLTRV